MLLLLFGCSNDTNDSVAIASEKTLPSNFHEIAFERETTPLFQFLVRKAVNQSEFEQTWSLYGFEDKKGFDAEFNKTPFKRVKDKQKILAKQKQGIFN